MLKMHMVNEPIRMVKKLSYDASLKIMTPYHFHPTVLVRTPLYAHISYKLTALADILQQSLFKKAIWFASEAFYRELEKTGFDIDKMDQKAINTLKKYVNRMHYRPTPFGLCSAFGVLSWGNKNSLNFDPEKLRPHLQLSYAQSRDEANKLAEHAQQKLIFKFNATLYRAGRQYRFIKSGGEGDQLEFMIDSLEVDRFFEKLVTYLEPGRLKFDITEWICQQINCSVADAEKYIQWLIDQQLILHQLNPNITGQDHLKRVMAETGERLVAVEQMEKTTRVYDLKEGSKWGSNDVYINLEIAFEKGEINTSFQQEILDGVKCLGKLSSTREQPVLKKFRDDFLKKFDQQAIPLLNALDPEIGVGYGDLETDEDNTHLLKDMHNTAGTAQRTSVSWSKVHALLLRKWQSNGGIILSAEDINGFDEEDIETPQSISVMFRVVGGKVFIESAGGVSATALIGRFTPFNPSISSLAKDMARKESEFNPEILFAEIAHICNEHTANIDRREHIYNYEIPVLVQSDLPAEKQLQLSDLWVTVRSGKVLLWSKKHQKRVIPRLSSAFNYTRNDLAVFRFLCDMQHPGIKTSMDFSLSRLFPDLDHYPRVTYQNTILQLAFWEIKKETFAAIFKAPPAQQYILFDKIRQSLGLPKYVALTQHDNQLVIDLDEPEEVLFLLDTIKSMAKVTLKEFLFPGDDEPRINQFIASVYQNKQIYRPIAVPDFNNLNTIRKLLPGSDWLYLKLYCHPIRTNELLKGPLYKLTRSCLKKGFIDEWFFIRYNDPEHHIRLRLKVTPGNHQNTLEHALKIITPLINEGLINSYVVDTYERELERYGSENMTVVESAFFAGSELVTSFLKSVDTPDSTDVLRFALISVKDIISAATLTGEETIRFLELVFNSFANEFNQITDLKHQLDTAFRQKRPIIEQSLDDQEKYYKQLGIKKERKLFIKSIVEINGSKNILADLIHMHLNRLFVTDSRKQEMAVYYFLLKHERSVLARKKTKIS